MEARALRVQLGNTAGRGDGLVAAPADDVRCSPLDLRQSLVSGAVVLVDRGARSFAQKEDAAAQRGAGAIIADNIDEQAMHGKPWGLMTSLSRW